MFKPKKESNTFMKVFWKPHALNYFALGYRRGIACAQNYSMQMQYPYKGILKTFWPPYHIQIVLKR
jgi:hypothetical protein